MEDFFARNIKTLRLLSGRSQVETAMKAGFKQSTWSGYENGTSKPNYEDLKKIIDYFDISASDLMQKEISNVHLNENPTILKDQKNVHLKVHRNVHLNKNAPCEECIRNKEILVLNQQLLSSQIKITEEKEARIQLLQNQLEQLQRDFNKLHEKPVKSARERKSA